MNQSLDLFEKNFRRTTQGNMTNDGTTQDLLPVDFSTITFVPVDQNTNKVQVVYSSRKSTNNLIVYLDRNKSLDMTSEREIQLGKIDSQWVWVK